MKIIERDKFNNLRIQKSLMKDGDSKRIIKIKINHNKR